MSETNAALRYRANEPSVIHQAIDGELVIIHLDHGLYYSLNSTGAKIWQALIAGESAPSVASGLARLHGARYEEVATAVDALVDRLQQEDLLVPVPGEAPASAGDASALSADDTWVDESADGFRAPVLQRYEDLQDLLLLDPIHAVDESGWPERRADA